MDKEDFDNQDGQSIGLVPSRKESFDLAQGAGDCPASPLRMQRLEDNSLHIYADKPEMDNIAFAQAQELKKKAQYPIIVHLSDDTTVSYLDKQHQTVKTAQGEVSSFVNGRLEKTEYVDGIAQNLSHEEASPLTAMRDKRGVLKNMTALRGERAAPTSLKYH